MATDRKIKICHLSSVHQATDTRIFYKECRSLAKVYKVTLIALAEKSQEVDGIKIIALKKYHSRFLRFLITDFVLLIKAIGEGADVYHFHDPELIVAGIVLKLAGKKVIYDVHENVMADLNEKKWLPFKSLAKSGYGFFETLALRYFYLILADKSYSDHYNQRLSASKYVVIQNLVPINDLKTDPPFYNSESNVLAFVGALDARRGLPFILDAIAILKRKGVQISLRCIGQMNEGVENILKNSLAWPEIKDQVEFKGFIPFPDSIQGIQDCMAGLALLENIPNNQISFSTKMFEYMAIGLPVICSDFQVFKDIIIKYDCGIAVNPEDSNAIADAILFLITHRQEAKRLSDNAKKGAKYFDWKTEEEKLLDFYEKIINNKI